MVGEFIMKTKGISLQTLCAPCNCHCRYCLLSWEKNPVGLPYEESEEFAQSFYAWIKTNRPELEFNFSYGYSMDMPQMFRAIDFMNSIGSIGGKLMQFDGMRFREENEIISLMHKLCEHGIEHLNFTFYGTRDYHNKFCGRSGDYEYMLLLIEATQKEGIEVSCGIPATHENASQIDQLSECLRECGVTQQRLFVPHEEGRGATLANIRLSAEDLALLPSTKKLLNTNVFKTEAEWCTSESYKQEENRLLIISLTPENIKEYREMGFEALIAHVEKLDDAFYNSTPSFMELAEKYGNPSSTLLYSQRDMYNHFQRLYIKDHGLDIYDVTDERYSGSRRY